MKLLVIALVALLGAIVVLSLLQVSDRRADNAEWGRLAALQPGNPPFFTAEMVEGLPEPAQRYFRYTIREGTPLLPVAELKMQGQFSLGNKHDPGYQPMDAQQILAAPEGFL